MPFTPFHMGPGIVLKALLRGCFSLMIFGWAQIVMDIQPLFVLLYGQGKLHGFSHTYLGATLLGILAAFSGKYLSEWLLTVLETNSKAIQIGWKVTLLSAFIGTYSHVFLDSIMHADVEPFFPITQENIFLELIPVSTLHKLCLGSALVGSGVYFFTMCLYRFKK